MILKLLKEEMFIPTEEYIINKRVNIRGTEVLLLSYTEDKNSNCLWFIYEQEEFINKNIHDEDESEEGFLTNRDKLLESIDSRSRNKIGRASCRERV